MVAVDWTMLIAAIGFVLLFAAFLFNQARKFRRFSFTYNGFNLVGAAILTWYAVHINDLLFMIVYGIWTFVAFYFLAKKALEKDFIKEFDDFDVHESLSKK